jgi:hypothetical protein
MLGRYRSLAATFSIASRMPAALWTGRLSITMLPDLRAGTKQGSTQTGKISQLVALSITAGAIILL